MTHVHICSHFTINKISWIFHLDNTVIANPKYFRLIWRSDDISFSFELRKKQRNRRTIVRKNVSLEFQPTEGEWRGFSSAHRAPRQASPLHGVSRQLQQQDLPDRWCPLLGLPRGTHQVGAQFNHVDFSYSNARTIRDFWGTEERIDKYTKTMCKKQIWRR